MRTALPSGAKLVGSLRRVAENMVQSASVCSRLGRHEEAVKLLLMSIDCLPLERRSEHSAKIVQLARNAAEVG